MHVVWLGMVVVVLPGHASHMRLDVAVPAVTTRVPARQSVQAMQAALFEALLKVPLAQAAQVRFVVALPGETTTCPGAQSRLGTHWLAALPSWSQLPMPQACGAAAPPGQYWPAAQGSHVGGRPSLAGAVWRVPASHSLTGKH